MRFGRPLQKLRYYPHSTKCQRLRKWCYSGFILRTNLVYAIINYLCSWRKTNNMRVVIVIQLNVYLKHKMLFTLEPYQAYITKNCFCNGFLINVSIDKIKFIVGCSHIFLFRLHRVMYSDRSQLITSNLIRLW